MEIEFILYVKDLAKSKLFYCNLFELKPTLDVPGMVEFSLAKDVKLGLMPESGISKIICPVMPNPSSANGIPRCELYIKDKRHLDFFNNALANGAKIISQPNLRNWGDVVSYVADYDGNIIALANS